MMRQYINTNHLKDMDTEIFLKLYKMCEDELRPDYMPKSNLHYIKERFEEGRDIGHAFKSWLTIGKMIEILKNKNHDILIETDSDNDYQWWVVVMYSNGKSFRNKELVTALWSAIKYVLAEKEG